jgi:hypothetical protein
MKTLCLFAALQLGHMLRCWSLLVLISTAASVETISQAFGANDTVEACFELWMGGNPDSSTPANTNGIMEADNQPHTLGTLEAKKKADEMMLRLGRTGALEMASWIKTGDPRSTQYIPRLAMTHFFKVLGSAAGPAVPTLIDSLGDCLARKKSDLERVNFILDVLGAIGESAIGATDAILAGVEHEQADSFLQHSVLALGHIGAAGTPAHLNHVSSFLGHTNPHVRLIAAITRSQLAPLTDASTAIVVDALKGQELASTHTALIFLPDFKGDRAPFIPCLNPLCLSSDRFTRAFAIRALGTIGEPAFASLQDLYRRPEPRAHSIALTGLKHYAAVVGARAWGPLEPLVSQALEEENPTNVVIALTVLQWLPDPLRTNPVLRAKVEDLARSGNQKVVREATGLLRKFTQ